MNDNDDDLGDWGVEEEIKMEKKASVAENLLQVGPKGYRCINIKQACEIMQQMAQKVSEMLNISE